MDFCRHLFAPTDPDMYRAVGARCVLLHAAHPQIILSILTFARIDPALMCPSGPILTKIEIDKLVDRTDEEAKAVLAEINARKPIHHMYNPKQNFISEAHHGLNAVIERGQLGLIAA
jgi:flavine halogenase